MGDETAVAAEEVGAVGGVGEAGMDRYPGVRGTVAVEDEEEAVEDMDDAEEETLAAGVEAAGCV